MWLDRQGNRERVDFYAGLDYTVYRFDQSATYEVFTKIDHQECASSSGSGDLVTILPDLDTWNYLGRSDIKGIPCEHFQQVQKAGSKVNTYDFYYYFNGVYAYPVRFTMMGYNVVFHSHYDLYTVEYGLYVPNFVSSSAFDRPSVCKAETTHTTSELKTSRHKDILKHMFPASPASDKAFSDFLAKYGKTCSGDCEKRMANFKHNVEYIDAHNAMNGRYTMGLNHFADMSFEEFSAMLLLPRGTFTAPHKAHHTHVVANTAAPAAVDWRDSGAVTPVKDQGFCGSCWAFGTTGTIEGVMAVKTGKLIPLSEQQLVSCAWNYGWGPYGNNGCDGGMPFRAMEYIMDNNGIDTSDSYPYIMMDGLCTFRRDRVGAKISGYVNVTMGDENALKDAVATMGPISVAIQVLESLVFFGQGVYYEPNCSSKYDDLNHAVLVVGYGTTPKGEDYWIVKNSWSTYWGDLGYVLMARNRGNNCGIATDPIYPIIA